MDKLLSSYQFPLRIFDMDFEECSTHLHRCPSLILPLGILEPIGKNGAIGLASRCSELLAEAFSSKLQVLAAPAIYYSCSTAFKSFEGSAGVRSRTFSNQLVEICKDWQFQGFKRILLINISSENDEAIDEALKRLNRGNNYVKCFSLQTDSRIRAHVSRVRSGTELGRSEFLILSLASFLAPEMVRKNIEKTSSQLLDVKQYQLWKKRGKDPQKFRKLFPDGSTSDSISESVSDFGKGIFEFIMTLLEDEYSPFLTVLENNA